jgi:hypothetical protein
MTTQTSGLTVRSTAAPLVHSGRIQFSYGLNAKDSHPTPYATTWDEFVGWLRSHYDARKPGPKDGPYVCAATFTDNHRHLKKGNPQSWAIPLDVDQAPGATADTIRATLHGYKFVAHTTHNHTTAVPRWRVFVALEHPVDAATHEATHRTLVGLFGGLAAANSCDATRVNYMPDRCKHPDQAEFIQGDGALYPPTAVVPDPPAVTEHGGDGPVPGWAGPADDTTLVLVACTKRIKPDETFGGPVHFAMYWEANEAWLAVRHPPSTDDLGKGRSWHWTEADAAFANECLFYTGGDIERSARLMRASGLGQLREGDDDWSERKVYLALNLGLQGRKPDQYYFMGKPALEAPPPADVPAGTTPPPEAPEPPGELDAIKNIPAPKPTASMNDYFVFMQDNTYLHRPSGKRMSATAVAKEIGKDAADVLVLTHPVHSLTWAPGMPERFTLDELDSTHVGGERVWLYNEYRAPRAPRLSGDVSLWLNLVNRLFPDDADHIVNYFADAVQNPGRKCNHALVLGSGVHGIGKDTLLAPLQYAVGEKNFRAIKPTALGESFNPWVRSVVVQISESRDLGDGFNSLSRYEMYERCKDLAAAPPRSLECNEKHKGQYPVANVLRLILTTNYQTDGLHMDPNDRRHYCAWSDAEKMSESDAMAMWAWYEAGGLEAVAFYLRGVELKARGFNRTAPPLRTDWWHQLVAGGASNEEDRFSDALDKLGRPEWATLPMVAEAGGPDLGGWMKHPGNNRKVEREMVKAGYQRLPNADDKRGRLYVQGVRQIVYRRSDIPAKNLLAQLKRTP